MEKKPVIEVRGVTMRFHMPRERLDSIKELFVKLCKRELKYDEFYALRGVSLSVDRGEVLGIIGRNGSGKSTLLKIVSGILRPTEGEVRVTGTVSPLIELGAGFDMDLTARENIYLNGSVLGFDHRFIRERYGEILDFAELRDFENVAIKNFSSGMIARLGFAIATLVKPDILIVDEILSVGDFLFQQKCERRIAEMMAGGTTVLFVSHSTEQIERLCTRVVWLEHGCVRGVGPTKRICEEYKNA